MAGERAAGALAGITVIDLTRVLGGPYATQILGDHGAEIIKVEPPQGDEVRDWGPPFDAGRDASYFIGINRNKRSLGLDLSRPEGQGVLLRLLEHADILIENYKPGAMEKWGLGYEAVLVERERSSQGQFIDMTLYDAGIALMHPHIPNYLLSGRLPALTGNAHPNISPYDKFPTRTVDVFLAIGNDRAFARLCAELDAPELASD